MPAAVYIRVSTEEQRERQSIETQRDFAERYCSLHEIPVSDWYADDGVSGTTPLESRTQGARLVEDAKRRRFDTVLVYKLDRLGRDPRLILNAIADFESSGIRVCSMTEPFDTRDPSGRFMVTVLSGVAGFERDTIIQRSVEGTNRLAREGAWLGGIVPFGYSVEGKKREARLVVSETPIPGTAYTEAGVIRLIYRIAGEEGRSCVWIAEHLNELGIPPAYVRDNRSVRSGKRKQATAGVWSPGRIRNMLVSTTYKGLHEYGKRSKKRETVIERGVPAVVDERLWRKAQEALRRNYLFSARNARRKYLLRGLIKCGLCGLTYIGTAYPSSGGSRKVYYVCNGKHSGRGIYDGRRKKCPSKAISGSIEGIIWKDVEGFLRNPGAVLERLREQVTTVGDKLEKIREEVADLKRILTGKEEERNRVLGLYRRGRIDDETLDKQLDAIECEKEALQERILYLESELGNSKATEAKLESTDLLLRELGKKLDGSLTWELKRRLVELLVESIRVDTYEKAGKKDGRVIVTYRFATDEPSIATRTGAREDRNWGIRRTYSGGTIRGVK